MSRPPRMFDAPPDYRPAIERIERLTVARLRDYGTAEGFTLRGMMPPVYVAAPLFDPEQQADTGPAPMAGQLTMEG
jgi:hypothetical protein